jgi:beta-xylosidase
VLTGVVNPSGRLPVGFPGAGSSQPSSYLAPPLAGPSEVSTIDPTPLFPFGHGLSYAPATWGPATSNTGERWATDGCYDVTLTVTNSHDRATSEVVQVYLHRAFGEVALPVRRLVATARVDLGPRQSGEVTFLLHADLTAYTGRARERIVHAGEVELRVAASSADVRSVLALTLTGPTRHVGHDRVLHPQVHISD